MNAAVLPLPVGAQRSVSLRDSKDGMACIWQGVGLTQFDDSTFDRTVDVNGEGEGGRRRSKVGMGLGQFDEE